MSARANPLRTAIAASPVHLAAFRAPPHGGVPARMLLVDIAPGKHPWLYVVWLDEGWCNWEPMSGWNDLVAELASRRATPDDAWQPVDTSRVQLDNGSWVVLLERDMTEAEKAAYALEEV